MMGEQDMTSSSSTTTTAATAEVTEAAAVAMEAAAAAAAATASHADNNSLSDRFSSFFGPVPGSRFTIIRAQHKYDGGEYAVKCVSLTDSTDGEQFHARGSAPRRVNPVQTSESVSSASPVGADFTREVTILSRLKHPNIIRYFQSWHDQESPYFYIQMEACVSTLRAAIDADRFRERDAAAVMSSQPVSDPSGPETGPATRTAATTSEGRRGDSVAVARSGLVWRIFQQLCDAVAHLHDEEGIAHCVLRPENVFLTHNFDAKIGNFDDYQPLVALDAAVVVTSVDAWKQHCLSSQDANKAQDSTPVPSASDSGAGEFLPGVNDVDVSILFDAPERSAVVELYSLQAALRSNQAREAVYAYNQAQETAAGDAIAKSSIPVVSGNEDAATCEDSGRLRPPKLELYTPLLSPTLAGMPLDHDNGAKSADSGAAPMEPLTLEEPMIEGHTTGRETTPASSKVSISAAAEPMDNDTSLQGGIYSRKLGPSDRSRRRRNGQSNRISGLHSGCIDVFSLGVIFLELWVGSFSRRLGLPTAFSLLRSLIAAENALLTRQDAEMDEVPAVTTESAVSADLGPVQSKSSSQPRDSDGNIVSSGEGASSSSASKFRLQAIPVPAIEFLASAEAQCFPILDQFLNTAPLDVKNETGTPTKSVDENIDGSASGPSTSEKLGRGAAASTQVNDAKPASSDTIDLPLAEKAPSDVVTPANGLASAWMPAEAQVMCRWLLRLDARRRPTARTALNESTLFPPVANLDPKMYHEALRIIRDTPPARQQLIEALMARPIDPATDFAHDLPRSALDSLLRAEGKKPLLHRKAPPGLTGATSGSSAPEDALLHTRLTDVFTTVCERFGAYRQMLPLLIPRITDDRSPGLQNPAPLQSTSGAISYRSDSATTGASALPSSSGAEARGEDVLDEMRAARDSGGNLFEGNDDEVSRERWLAEVRRDWVSDATSAAVERHYDNVFGAGAGFGSDDDDTSSCEEGNSVHRESSVTGSESDLEDELYREEDAADCFLSQVCSSVALEPTRPVVMKRPVVLLTAEDVKVQLPTRSCESFAWFLARAFVPFRSGAAQGISGNTSNAGGEPPTATSESTGAGSAPTNSQGTGLQVSHFKRYDIARVFQARPAGVQEAWEASFDWVWSFSNTDVLRNCRSGDLESSVSHSSGSKPLEAKSRTRSALAVDGWESDEEDVLAMDDSSDNGNSDSECLDDGDSTIDKRINAEGLSVTVETLVFAARLIDEIACAQFPGLAQYVHFVFSLNHSGLRRALLEACGFELCFHDTVQHALSQYVRGSLATQQRGDASGKQAPPSNQFSPNQGTGAKNIRRSSGHNSTTVPRSPKCPQNTIHTDDTCAPEDVVKAAVAKLPLQGFSRQMQKLVKVSNAAWAPFENNLLNLGCAPEALAVLRIFTMQVKPTTGAVASLFALLDLFDVVAEMNAKYHERPAVPLVGSPGFLSSHAGNFPVPDRSESAATESISESSRITELEHAGSVDPVAAARFLSGRRRRAANLRRIARYGTDIVQYMVAVVRSYYVLAGELTHPEEPDNTTQRSEGRNAEGFHAAPSEGSTSDASPINGKGRAKRFKHRGQTAGPSLFLRFDPGLCKAPQYDSGILFEIHACGLPVTVASRSTSRSNGSRSSTVHQADGSTKDVATSSFLAMKWSLCSLIAEGGRYDNLVQTCAAITRPTRGFVGGSKAGLLPLSSDHSHRSVGSVGAPLHQNHSGRTAGSASRYSAGSGWGSTSGVGRRSWAEGSAAQPVGGIDNRHVIGVTFALSELAEFTRVIDRRIIGQRHSRLPARSLRELLDMRREQCSKKSRSTSAMSTGSGAQSLASILSLSNPLSKEQLEYQPVHGPRLRGGRGSVLVCCDTGFAADGVAYRLRIARALWAVGIQAEIMHPEKGHLREYSTAVQRTSAAGVRSGRHGIEGIGVGSIFGFDPEGDDHNDEDAMTWLMEWCHMCCFSHMAVIRGTGGDGGTRRHHRGSAGDWSTERITNAMQYHIKLVRLASPRKDGTRLPPQISVVKSITDLVQLSRAYFVEDGQRHLKSLQRHQRQHRTVTASFATAARLLRSSEHMSSHSNTAVGNAPGGGDSGNNNNGGTAVGLSNNPWETAVFVRLRAKNHATDAVSSSNTPGLSRSGAVTTLHMQVGGGSKNGGSMLGGGGSMPSGDRSANGLHAADSVHAPRSASGSSVSSLDSHGINSSKKSGSGSGLPATPLSHDGFAVPLMDAEDLTAALHLGSGSSPGLLVSASASAPAYLKIIAVLHHSHANCSLARGVELRQVAARTADHMERSGTVWALLRSLHKNQVLPFAAADALARSLHVIVCGGNVGIHALRTVGTAYLLKHPTVRLLGRDTSVDGAPNGGHGSMAVLERVLQILRRLQGPLNHVRERVARDGKANVLEAGGGNILDTPATFVLLYSLRDQQFDIVAL